MNEQYRAIHKQAVDLQFRFRDCVKDTNQSTGRSLESQVQKLVDSIEAQANPRSLEDQIKQIQRQLKDLDQSDPPVIDNNRAEGLHDDYERLRMDLRELDNY